MNIRIRFKNPKKPIRFIKGSDLAPHPQNWRTHPPAQLDALKGLFAEVGFCDVLKGIELDDGRVMLLDGHARAEVLPDQEIPVLVLDLDEAEAKKLLATYDPIGSLAGTNTEQLDALLREVQTESPGLQAMLDQLILDNGLDTGNEISESEDYEPPEPPAIPITQPGDLWLLGKHRLLCGDATRPEDIAKLMAGAKADLLLTDPPYGVAYTGGTSEALTIQNDDLDEPALRQFLVRSMKAAVPHLKPGGSFYIWHADSLGHTFRAACIDAGLRIRQCLIWVKSSLCLGRQDYHWKHEPCLYGWADGAAHTWLADRSQTTVLEFDKPSRNAEHPTMKPVELFAYLVGNSCKPGGVVLDPFAGSGTTVIACEKLGRQARVTELDPRYCDVIVQRWEQATGQKAERVPGNSLGNIEHHERGTS